MPRSPLVTRVPSRSRSVAASMTGRIARASYLTELTARLARWRPRPRRGPAHSKIAAFIHGVLAAIGDCRCAAAGELRWLGPSAIHAEVGRDDLTFVGVGPHRNFRARRWRMCIAGDRGTRPRVVPVEQLAPRRAIRDSYAVWRHRHALARDIVSGEGIRDAARIEGCDLWTCLHRGTHACRAAAVAVVRTGDGRGRRSARRAAAGGSGDVRRGRAGASTRPRGATARYSNGRYPARVVTTTTG